MGFSEDLNQDGFVDPIGQAVPVVAAPVHTYAVAAPAVQSYAVAAPAVKAEAVEVKAAPVAPLAYTVPHAVAPAATVPLVHHVGYQVHHQVQHVPQVSVQKHVTHHTTQHVINHAPVVGAFTGLLPAHFGVVPQAAVAAPVEEAPAV